MKKKCKTRIFSDLIGENLNLNAVTDFALIKFQANYFKKYFLFYFK